MSIHKNRNEVKYLTNRRTYHILTTIDQDPYAEEFWSTHHRRTFKSMKGSKNLCSWKRKVIYQFQYRMYRSWKYNRKNQWKD